MHFLAYKLPKMLFFAQKYLTRYNFETFFVEHMNFKIFLYSSHCEVIPVQRFGSHICPQPPRLGLRNNTTSNVYDVPFLTIFVCTSMCGTTVLQRAACASRQQQGEGSVRRRPYIHMSCIFTMAAF
jgi:hypothetical protein